MNARRTLGQVKKTFPLLKVWALVLLAGSGAVGTATGQQRWGGGGQRTTGGAEKLAIKETSEEVTIALEGDVLFDFDRAELKDAAEASLQRVDEIVQRYPQGRVLVEGHTDGLGPEAYNLQLSNRRAESVKSWLVGHGVAAGRIDTRGCGMSRPVAPNTNPDGSDNPTGRAKNRRVEITVSKH